MRMVARAVLVLSFGACGSAHVIHRDQQGGILQLDGDHDKAFAEATHMMAEHCGDHNFSIVKDGEETLGGPPATTGSGSGSGSDATHAPPVTVYRVTYECGLKGSAN